jgi:hypothetical protein
MVKIGHHTPLKDAITGTDAGESRAMLEKELRLHRQHLRELSDECNPMDRSRLNLSIAEILLGLGQFADGYVVARDVFSVCVEYEAWQEAVEACDIMYQCDQDHSIVALGHGVWLAVTYPIKPQLTIDMLHHIVDETPDNSDGGAVAAAMAHYMADLRCQGKERERLMFATAQILAQVAKRHRGISDEEGIHIWMEVLQLNDINELLPRLARVIDIMAADQWWIDRDVLRARLPVN